MEDMKSDTSELLANESKEENSSPLSQRAYLAFDPNSHDSNNTLTANHLISDKECQNIHSINKIDSINNHNKDQELNRSPIGYQTVSRPFFTFPRLLSGRRKRIKRKGLIPNDCSVTRIEEHSETDSIGHLSTTTTATSTSYRNPSNIYVKENFFIRLMRHLASPVHGSGHSAHNGYYSDQSNSTIRRRSKRGSFVSSASNGDINRSQIYRNQNEENLIHQRNNQSSNNGYEMPAVCGIKNHGNTCFMNAIIQCLCNTDLLAEYFVMNHYRIDLRHNKLHARKYGTKGEVTEQLALVLKSLWSCMYSSEISYKFKLLVAKYGTQYEGSDQHDAQEFLLWLLDKCHEDLNIANKKKYKKIKGLSQNRTDELIAAETLANHMRCNSSFIHDLFQAQLRSSLVCRSCGKHSNTFDPYLCLSLPVPTRLTHTLIVNSVYLNKIPREVKIGVSIESLGTIRELRDKISRLLKIPEKQLVLLLVGQDFGLKEIVKDTDIIQEILEDMDNIFAVETPKLPQIHTNTNSVSALGTNACEQMLTLVWANRIGIGSQGKIFGSLFSTLVSREASYKQIQLDIMNAMRSLIKQYSDISSICCGLNLRLRVIGGIPGKCYLPEDVDHPLYMPTVDKALTGTEDKEYRGPVHLKLVVEWDLDIRQELLISDEEMEKPINDSSIELAKARSQKTNRATLQDCFDMYFKEEKLAADNAWMCPACKRRQQCIKKLSLWSVPDIFIIHLKRFRQASNSQRSKLTTLILFPQNGLEMNSYIAPRFVPQTNGNINNTLPSLWSPWKRPRIFGKFARIDDNTYDLYAVCNHRGSMQSGHYTAYCRNPIDGCWYLFDDTKVVPVQESSIITADAYILFYQRSSLSSALSSCASSSTSGYSSSASSYYSDHWAFRMPPFNYWSPKSSKSQDNLSSDTINETNSAKSDSTTPPTPITLTRGQRAYASLPSKNSQHKAKMTSIDNKNVSNINNTSNDNSTQLLAQTEEFKTVETKYKENNSLITIDSPINNETSNSKDSEENESQIKEDDSKYWAITSV